MVKLLLTKAPILVPPTDGEPLLLYIAATTQVVSAALVVEREEEGHTLKVQCPVYFISEVLSDSKTHYPQIEKLLVGYHKKGYPKREPKKLLSPCKYQSQETTTRPRPILRFAQGPRRTASDEVPTLRLVEAPLARGPVP